MAGQPPYYDSPEKLQNAIDSYFEDDNCPNTITGLAYFLGFADRQSLNDYEERPEYSFIIKSLSFRRVSTINQRSRIKLILSSGFYRITY
jgi:hypothetical protein